nr:MAG TPA: AT hook containing protein [Caudoviricetes sp.]
MQGLAFGLALFSSLQGRFMSEFNIGATALGAKSVIPFIEQYEASPYPVQVAVFNHTYRRISIFETPIDVEPWTAQTIHARAYSELRRIASNLQEIADLNQFDKVATIYVQDIVDYVDEVPSQSEPEPEPVEEEPEELEEEAVEDSDGVGTLAPKKRGRPRKTEEEQAE